MSLVQRVLGRLVCILAISLVASVSPAYAQTVERGIGAVQVQGRTPTPQERSAALSQAKFNAIERFIALNGGARATLFEQSRSQIVGAIDQYVLNAVVLSEEHDAGLRRLTLVARVEINEPRLNATLTPVSSVRAQAQSDVVLVYLSRAASSEQVFADRVLTRSDLRTEGQQSFSGSSQGRESERVRSGSVSTADEVQQNSQYSTSASVVSETGGSTTRRAAVYQYQVASASDVAQSMTGVFAAAGMNVVDSEFIEGIDLDAIRADFGEGDDLRPETLRGLVAAVRGAGVAYLSIGTLTNGLADRDPVSGNQRVGVTVSAKLYDLTRQFPRVISSVGPVQFAGLGANEMSARTTAMQAAAQRAATQLVEEMVARGEVQ